MLNQVTVYDVHKRDGLILPKNADKVSGFWTGLRVQLPCNGGEMVEIDLGKEKWLFREHCLVARR